MSPTITSALQDFINAVTSLAAGVINSVLAVFTALWGFGVDIFTTLVQLAQSVLKFGIDLCQGVIGFVVANFFAIAVIGGAYYLYTNRQNQGQTDRDDVLTHLGGLRVGIYT
ncbi:hypothetical protein MPER_11849 [Moniliophthora perniciosa FA553]|nr:hypothetical protein MPER_11849 [Moniliophthora perniciosa FA553]